ncbi:MAG TPA: hypothetical protein VF633_00225 [Brevundimonas sp.]|jgi:hypothetical protein
MSVHDSRNWKATESTDFAGGNRGLTVTGDVQVGAGNQRPLLNRTVPQGFNPSILYLDLSTETAGDVGTDALVWRTVSYEEPIEEDQFAQVDVRGAAVFDVEKLIS